MALHALGRPHRGANPPSTPHPRQDTPQSSWGTQVGAVGSGGTGRSCGDQERQVEWGESRRCRLVSEQSRVSETLCTRQRVPTASRLPPRKLRHPAQKNKTPRMIPTFSKSPLKSNKNTERTNGRQVLAGHGRGENRAVTAGQRRTASGLGALPRKAPVPATQRVPHFAWQLPEPRKHFLKRSCKILRPTVSQQVCK